jgi:hypothetical protein
MEAVQPKAERLATQCLAKEKEPVPVTAYLPSDGQISESFEDPAGTPSCAEPTLRTANRYYPLFQRFAGR